MQHPGETRLRKPRDPWEALGQFLGLMIVGGGFILFVFYVVFLCLTGG